MKVIRPHAGRTGEPGLADAVPGIELRGVGGRVSGGQPRHRGHGRAARRVPRRHRGRRLGRGGGGVLLWAHFLQRGNILRHARAMPLRCVHNYICRCIMLKQVMQRAPHKTVYRTVCPYRTVRRPVVYCASRGSGVATHVGNAPRSYSVTQFSHAKLISYCAVIFYATPLHCVHDYMRTFSMLKQVV